MRQRGRELPNGAARSESPVGGSDFPTFKGRGSEGGGPERDDTAAAYPHVSWLESAETRASRAQRDMQLGFKKE